MTIDMKTINLFYIELTAVNRRESQLFEYNKQTAVIIFSNTYNSKMEERIP